ncbi:hypothetical protein Pla52o_17020 [Novipirellula galeiformis]|uniref:Uncharacterized protein n=1 Tax=Novipirellula galeiformis TaxID=2528004 RepID=A0A5C6CPS4_9BACT|nr:hypothetical protein Pla52o_17020 [Novipirellula galeiformis]
MVARCDSMAPYGWGLARANGHCVFLSSALSCVKARVVSNWEIVAELIRKLKWTGPKVRRAQILLKADAEAPAWTLTPIANAVFFCAKTVGYQATICRAWLWANPQS